MIKPYIFALDDDTAVLNAVVRDLRRHYRGKYRIMSANSGAEALQAIHQLKQRDAPVALFLVDQRMPEMSGTEFLKQASRFYPEARKVLLTAYADTEAAIDSINAIGLDYYLLKPWDPPETHLFPVLDDLIENWQSTVQLPYEGIRVVGSIWSSPCHDVKDFLSRNRIPYRWYDIEKDPQAVQFAEATQQERYKLPIVILPDGKVLNNPSYLDLANEIGLKTQATEPFYDFIIVGGGPAGLAAAVYGASEGLKTLLIEKEATGGQAGTSSRIENYLGFPKGLSGLELAHRATVQATRLGAEILTAQEVARIRVDGPYRFVGLRDGVELGCKALLIATGVTVNKLEVPGIDAITGAGVYYGAALTEAANFRDQPVFVVGGANSAGQGAMFFSRYASQVTMLVRSTSLATSMSQYLVDQIADTENIDVLTRTEVIEVHGKDRLEAITICNKDTMETVTLPAAALFIFIGAVAHTGFIDGTVERNSAGFILTGKDLTLNGKYPARWNSKRDPYLFETSVPGIFAAGDVRSGSTKRVASAVGEGSVAVRFVHQYLEEV
jgi:thioredoxin reductase (NADPH)